MESLRRFITAKLKVKVNQQKSAVARLWDRKFLGFSFTSAGIPKRRIAPKAVDRFKERSTGADEPEQRRQHRTNGQELSRYLMGWLGYFGKCETPSVLAGLDRWLRRRLRSGIWKQWKRGPARLPSCESETLMFSLPRKRQAALLDRGGWHTLQSTHERKRSMTVENMNGIDVPALNAFVDRVKTDPDQRAVTSCMKEAVAQ
jgi:RNA-directed DNA polymerase